MSTIRARLQIFLAFSVLASFTTGCSSEYRLPDTVTNPAVITGDVLSANGNEDWSVILNFDTREVEIPNDAPSNPTADGYYEKYALLELKIKPGLHKLDISRIRKLTNSSIIDLDRLPSIEANLSPGGTYRLTGEVVLGSAFKYWIEDANTGERVTDVFYDPSELEEILVGASCARCTSDNYALLKSNVKHLFPSKVRLYPDRDCFNLITEVIIDPEKVAFSSVFVLVSFRVDTLYLGEYGYRVYEDICIGVKEGHEYAIKLRYRNHCDVCDGGEEDHLQGDDIWYEVWDTTENLLLVEFELNDLEVVLDRVD